MNKTIKQQSEQQIARAEKQRVARVEGAKAMIDVDKDAIAVRKNMERLRALRLAKEAEDAANAPPPAPKKVKKAAKKKDDPKATAAKLAEFLATQRDSGRGT
jgi:hypothetical protein